MTTSGQQAPIEQVALRVNSPDRWTNPDRPEASFEVASRISHDLGTSSITEEIRNAGIDEANRQKEIYEAWRSTVRKKEEYNGLRDRMGKIAVGLVDALVPADDSRNRDVIVNSVLNALKPLDDRLVQAEWDGRIG